MLCWWKRETIVLSVGFVSLPSAPVGAWERLLLHAVMSVRTESGQPICGNGIVEPGEECDCGYIDQCNDTCCYNANEVEGKKCKLQPGKICRSDMSSGPFLAQSCASWDVTEHQVLIYWLLVWLLISFWSVICIPQSQPRPMLHIHVHF